MNKNSNIYQIVYAAVMVLIVGTILAFIYMALKPKQDENIANDKRKQILSAVHMTPASDNSIQDTFNKYIVAGYLLDKEGQIVDSAQNVAFDVDMKNNIKASERKLPVFKCRLDDGSIKYIVPVYGAGLWGPIWGYIAVDDNGTDIYGAYFSHEGETPGLGARIADKDFQDEFVDKHLFQEGEFKGVVVLKKGQKSVTGAEQIDALTGATITSLGVSAMLEDCLAPYKNFLMKLQGDNGAQPAADAAETEINDNQPE